MNFQKTAIPSVLLLQPKVISDNRGFFLESYQKKNFFKAGIPYDFVQDNHSSSVKSTLRGLHYQISHTQGKLVRVVIGKIFDIAVDLQKSSPFFGQWVGAVLSAENKRELWIPPGFAHGFLVLSEQADVIYKATDYYAPESERCIRWDDPKLAIDWPIPEGELPIVSEKDMMGLSFEEAEVFE
ncbi:dTDP-4-dehydrorhamnose 3,5-epimerase [bacterium]|nr:dTDP-4-dehydrorhamnose 3,5-epimerase [bacterium]